MSRLTASDLCLVASDPLRCSLSSLSSSRLSLHPLLLLLPILLHLSRTPSSPRPSLTPRPRHRRPHHRHSQASLSLARLLHRPICSRLPSDSSVNSPRTRPRVRSLPPTRHTTCSSPISLAQNGSTSRRTRLASLNLLLDSRSRRTRLTTMRGSRSGSAPVSVDRARRWHVEPSRTDVGPCSGKVLCRRRARRPHEARTPVASRDSTTRLP